MPKSVDPQLIAFLVCEKVLHDVRTNNKSFIGVFNNVMTPAVPFAHPEFYVAIVLTGCHGEQKISLELLYDDNDGQKSLVKLEGMLKSQDPLEVVELIFDLRNLNFEKFGKYTFRLISGDTNVIAYRYLRVTKMNLMKGGIP